MNYFTQQPPGPENQIHENSLLVSYLQRSLPENQADDVIERLKAMEQTCTDELYSIQQQSRGWEPELESWDAWGNRIDRVPEGPLWNRAREVSLEYGLSSLPYKQPFNQHSRVVQASLICLFHPVSGFFTCPLAMTDGAASAIRQSGNQDLIDEQLPRLTSNQKDRFVLSGQWMTETSGGSDLSRTETEARKEDGTWKLYGKKWFVSAVDAEVALVLARPETNSDKLAGFFVDLEQDAIPGSNLTIDRLKDKLGTRRLPTAEVTLSGLPGKPVDGLSGGIKTIGPMLNRARFWNSACAVGEYGHALTMLEDYAQNREVFNQNLEDQPMFRNLIKQLRAELVSGLYFTLHLAGIMGEFESGSNVEENQLMIRLLTPLAKLSTARQAVHGVSEALEGFGGMGYMEDTGLARKLRDAQVFPIWEGATNVLILEFLETLVQKDGWGLIKRDLQTLAEPLAGSRAEELTASITNRIETFERWLTENSGDFRKLQENGRHHVFALIRAYHIGLLGRQATWELENRKTSACMDLARRLNRSESSFFPR